MEFFYKIGEYEGVEILGSNLYYTQDEFDDIVSEIKVTYNDLEDDFEDTEYRQWKIKNDIYGWKEFLKYHLKDECKIYELDISAEE